MSSPPGLGFAWGWHLLAMTRSYDGHGGVLEGGTCQE
jgi:hypothetical protein